MDRVAGELTPSAAVTLTMSDEDVTVRKSGQRFDPTASKLYTGPELEAINATVAELSAVKKEADEKAAAEAAALATRKEAFMAEKTAAVEEGEEFDAEGADAEWAALLEEEAAAAAEAAAAEEEPPAEPEEGEEAAPAPPTPPSLEELEALLARLVRVHLTFSAHLRHFSLTVCSLLTHRSSVAMTPRRALRSAWETTKPRWCAHFSLTFRAVLAHFSHPLTHLLTHFLLTFCSGERRWHLQGHQQHQG